MTPRAFYDLCAKHDWTYDHSDDHRVWRKGFDEHYDLDMAIKGDTR